MSYKIKEVYLQLHEAWTIVLDPPKIMDVNFPLNTSNLKFPVTSHGNPPYLKCIHMVQIYAFGRSTLLNKQFKYGGLTIDVKGGFP